MTVGKRGIVAWALYDWGNSAVSTIVFTFVFATYFATGVYGNEAEGQAALGFALGVYGAVVLFGAPVLGAIADRVGRRKPWIAAFTAASVIGVASLWFVEPDQSWIAYALIAFGLANIGFEFAIVFYNAMLPSVAPPGWIGRVSGWAWGFGYFGGVVSLAVCLFVFLQPDPPPFGLDPDMAEHVRVTSVVAAVWMAVFAIPLFLLTPDAPSTGVKLRDAVGAGLRQLVETVRTVRTKRDLAIFLVGSALYRDGLGLLFAFGGVYAANKYGMSFDELVQFAIGMNVTAGIGSVLLARFDDKLGSKPTILISLVLLIIIGSATLLAPDKTWFFGLALTLGLFIGPAQSAGRSMVARLSPPEIVAEAYGLYAMTGKTVAAIGPFLLGVMTVAYGQTAGMFVAVALWVLGGIAVSFVRDRGERSDYTA
ncbi:MAG: MFS transporter [Pseudomonadota bacterium]